MYDVTYIYMVVLFRFDPDGAGAVKTSHFLKVLGLDETGVPRPFTTPRYISMGNACTVTNPQKKEPEKVSRVSKKNTSNARLLLCTGTCTCLIMFAGHHVTCHSGTVYTVE